jgi:hypothetical protein
VDTTSSNKKKALAKTQTADTPPAIPVKPIAIASKLFRIQQRLYRLAEATNISIYPYISLVPKNVSYPRYGHLGFSNIFFNFS